MNNENNKVVISGEIVSDFEFLHEIYGEKFFQFNVKVPRLSGAFDVLPVIISERLIIDQENTNKKLNNGDKVNIVGQFRSFNKIFEGKSRLILKVFVQEFLENIPEKPNEIYLNGYICKPPVYRTTPLDREISDVLIAVNRAYNKSDYIPCIAWGRNAKFAAKLNVGDKISIYGRIQSREYQKTINETEKKKMTAYEVSISSLSVGEWED